MLECAVIDGNGSRETLISLEMMKKWGILHPTFPNESIEDFVNRKYLNKNTCYYSEVLNLSNNLYAEGRTIREPGCIFSGGSVGFPHRKSLFLTGNFHKI